MGWRLGRQEVVAPGEKVRTFTDEFDGYRLANGSSSATAYTAGALALVWSAYPEATGNQILQTLVRNTDGEDHELYWDEHYGYGVVNVRHMLDHDPTTYPDVNPLLVDNPGAVPSIAEVTNPTPLATATTSAAATPTPVPTPVPTPSAAPSTKPVSSDDQADDSDSRSTAPLLVGAAAILAALVAVVALAVRRARANHGAAGGPDATPPTHQPGQEPRPGGQ